MSISYNYVEITTFNHLYVGDGRGKWHHWGLLDHKGVTIRLDFLGYPEAKSCFLPANILKKLYTNFDNYHEYVGILFSGDLYEIIAEKRFDSKTADEMHENRQGFLCLNYTDEEQGYPYLLPLLPELEDMDFLTSLANDPTLDMNRFYQVLPKLKGNVSNGNIYNYRHPRWSYEWLEYCERLVKKNPNMNILDKSYFLKLTGVNTVRDYEKDE